VEAKTKKKGKEGEQCGLLMIPRADHFDLIDPRSKAWDPVEQTIRHVLGIVSDSLSS
jgi:hypothetical protein